MRTMAAGEFKAKCLSVMDEVKASGQPIHITKRGKVVALLVAPEEAEQRRINVNTLFGGLRGMVTVAGDPNELVEPIIPREEWDHLKKDWSPFRA